MTSLWETKLAARLHDPAEKALVLLRDPAGHENGTSLALARLAGLAPSPQDLEDAALAHTVLRRALEPSTYEVIRRADWWAAAADRPQWPLDEIEVPTKDGKRKTLAVAPWAQVHWTKRPILIHPLSGATLNLGSLATTEIEAFKQRAFDHFSSLLVELGAKEAHTPDWKKILLAFWRFGPELDVTNSDAADAHRLGPLWGMLPADTRVPDHTIWDHLDLTSAFAGAFASDPEGTPALLSFSLGPVQEFIAAARKMDDLWAGSHLLSRLSWEAMRPLCEALGPDAILFPRLRGIALVDRWLIQNEGLPASLFEHCEWRQSATDANPLFAAALPNRFVALVPASKARELAERCRDAARAWLLEQGLASVDRLLEAIGEKATGAVRQEFQAHAYAQVRDQLKGFPEVHWSAIPFSLVHCRDPERQRDLDTRELQEAMAPFYGTTPEEPAGFLASDAWRLLSGGIELTTPQGRKLTFFAPNPGALYPAVYELGERALAATKSLRVFDQLEQKGWRDSLTGESEPLALRKEELSERQNDTSLWARVAQRKPSWAKRNERLGALGTIKRLWPTRFAEEVEDVLHQVPARFVVTTHTMALAHQLERWLEAGGKIDPALRTDIERRRRDLEAVALPRRLARRYGKNEAFPLAGLLPALLEGLEDEANDEAAAKEAAERERLLRRVLAGDGNEAPLETYYALLLMDGDRMGAILSGEDEAGTAIPFRESFHPQVRQAFDARASQHPTLERYGKQRRPVSPGRHLAISAALGDFAQTVARHVVEEEHLGRILYAGGDDVLAMLPVADVLSCAQRLRHAYSGTLPEDADMDWGELAKDPAGLHCKNGFAWLRGRLMRMMGERATASCGVVIAHHQAPLSAVLRELRSAERRAKSEGGRNAFSLSILKRSGGALRFTAPWGEPLALLVALRDFLAHEDVSRRAVYHTLTWLADLPDPRAEKEMFRALLAYQFVRQSGPAWRARADKLAEGITHLATTCPGEARDWLANYLAVAEFLARQVRARTPAGTPIHAHSPQEVV